MNLKEPLRALFSEGEVGCALRWYDVVGDIGVIELSPDHEHLQYEIADAILNAYPDLRMVAKRTARHGGEFRVASLVKIKGEGGFATIHKEFGLKLHVDLEAVYFSPRSAAERFRVAGQVNPGEKVLVMFSGIGPFALMIGLHAESSEIIGIEKNPKAHCLAQRNLEANKKARNIVFLNGDVEEVLPEVNKQFDRIVMPLPLAGRRYLNLALRNLLPGGMLHFYDFQYRNEFEESLNTVRTACVENDRKMIHGSLHRCGHIGSRRFRVCVDAEIR
jgi:tRNA (guanine37-N1)-methyltransferase